MGNRKNNSARTWNRITRISWEHLIKVAEAQKGYGSDLVAVDLLEFKQLREELIWHELKRVILDQYIDTNNLLIGVLGNIPISYLTHQHNRDVIIVFKKLLFHRTRKYPDKSLKELL